VRGDDDLDPGWIINCKRLPRICPEPVGGMAGTIA
jgi:hypothetical protein